MKYFSTEHVQTSGTTRGSHSQLWSDHQVEGCDISLRLLIFRAAEYLNMYLLSLRNGIWTSERDFSSSKGGESPYYYLILNSVIPTEIRTPGQNLHSQQIPWIWCGACSWKGQWWHPLLAPHTPCSPRGAQWTAPAERQQKSDLRDHFPKICPSCSTRNQTKPAENSAPLLLLRRNIR